MNGGTIFVLALALGFLAFIVYLSRLSQAGKTDSSSGEAPASTEEQQHEAVTDAPVPEVSKGRRGKKARTR